MQHARLRRSDKCLHTLGEDATVGSYRNLNCDQCHRLGDAGKRGFELTDEGEFPRPIEL